MLTLHVSLLVYRYTCIECSPQAGFGCSSQLCVHVNRTGFLLFGSFNVPRDDKMHKSVFFTAHNNYD
jgi:hypothetical protein